jgi:NYN domain-containing protein
MPVAAYGGNILLRSWMLFVDGENFTIRAQRFAQENGILLVEGAFYRKDVFIWLPMISPLSLLAGNLQNPGVRAIYYNSVVADDRLLLQVKEELWKLGFSPQAFKKDSQSKKTKGVDITLTKGTLSHAFLGNYEAAVLVAGDADYVPLVEEVKRLGKLVYIVFFESQGLSPELRRSADQFWDIANNCAGAWKSSHP